MKSLAPFALVLLAGVAQAAAIPASAQPAQQRMMPPMRKYPGVSDAGNAILADAQQAPDPQMADIMRQQRGIHDQLTALAMAPTIDLDRVATLLRQREDLQMQYRSRIDEKLVQAMRQLPIADRGPFMRALVTPPAPGGMPPR